MKYWFVFKEDNVLLERLPNGSFTIPQADTPPVENAAEAHVLRVSSMADGTEVRAVSVNTFADNPRYLLGQEHTLLRRMRCPHADAYRDQQALLQLRKRGLATIGHGHHRIDTSR